MAKQPEQILEEQLVAQSKALSFGLVVFSMPKSVKINVIKNLTLKMFTEFKKGITFVSTVPALHTVRSASGSFFSDSNFTNHNTPPMPLHDAHLGGFLFL